MTAPAAYAQDVAYESAPQSAPSFSQPQLDQMMAPIALYPDSLVGQILMASTYPLEIVEASRWLQNTNNAALRGDQLAAAIEQQPWDPSVKSLVPFPQVLHMMDSNIQWTEQVGDAFLAQQPAVMDSVQRLRQQAEAAGTLTSTPQQIVETQGPDIVIEPENPNVVYVPAYNPALVYGTWEYPDYAPYSFYSADYVYGGAFLGFGIGIAVIDSLWGWNHWDWQHHRVDIDDRRFSELNRGQPPLAHGVWQYNPEHRHGVPFHDAATRARFQGTASNNRGLRGYAPATGSALQTGRPTSSRNVVTPQSYGRRQTVGQERVNSEQNHLTPAPQTFRQTNGYIRPAIEHAPEAAPMQPRSQPSQERAQPQQMQRAASPVFESFSHGSDARAQSERGSYSRATAPVSPAPRSNGGGGGGSGGGGRDQRNRQ